MKALTRGERSMTVSDNASKKTSKKTLSVYLKGALVLGGASLLGISMIAIPAPPAEAGLNLFSSPRDKQARGSVPGRRRGGARRGSCPNTERALIALVPATEVETETLPETYVGGVTTAEHPTLWFDVPYALTDDITAEFVLQDSQGQDVYRTTSAEFAAAKQTPGLIDVSVSSEISLETGKTYQWYFKVNCGSDSPSYVQGGIERIAASPEIANQTAAASPLEKAALYQKNAIWYDVVDIIAPLYLAQPNDPSLITAWEELLRSLNL